MYINPIDNLVLLSSFFFYLILILWAIIKRLASQPEAISTLNRLHFKIAIYYALTSVIIILLSFHSDLSYSFLSLSVGLFCYFTYHYVFFISFISLAKRSVSANILVLIHSSSGQCPLQNLSKSYGDGKGTSFIVRDRLEQMVFLDFAVESNSEYRITSKGKFVNFFSVSILKIWNLKRI